MENKIFVIEQYNSFEPHEYNEFLSEYANTYMSYLLVKANNEIDVENIINKLNLNNGSMMYKNIGNVKSGNFTEISKSNYDIYPLDQLMDILNRYCYSVDKYLNTIKEFIKKGVPITKYSEPDDMVTMLVLNKRSRTREETQVDIKVVNINIDELGLIYDWETLKNEEIMESKRNIKSKKLLASSRINRKSVATKDDIYKLFELLTTITNEYIELNNEWRDYTEDDGDLYDKPKTVEQVLHEFEFNYKANIEHFTVSNVKSVLIEIASLENTYAEMYDDMYYEDDDELNKIEVTSDNIAEEIYFENRVPKSGKFSQEFLREIFDIIEE